jgi:hypothetical protein
MAKKSQKMNWVIQADNESRNEEQTFLSVFGELQNQGLGIPNTANLIYYAIASISYYEHHDGGCSSLTLKKCMMVCILFSYPIHVCHTF